MTDPLSAPSSAPVAPAGSRPTVLVVQSDPDGGPGRFLPALAAVAELDLRRADLGDPVPTRPTGYAGLLVLGGEMGAGDDDVAPWLPATRGLLAAGVAAGIPTLGICLGAQLLAAATGGRVERGAAGPEIGVTPLTVLPEGMHDAFVGPLAALPTAGVPSAARSRPVVAQYHHDAVTELPPGAVLLATGERYPCQAFRLGDRAWGVQYHPEVAPSDFTRWFRGPGAPPEGVVARCLADFAAAEETLAAVARAHVTVFSRMVAGTVARTVSPVAAPTP